MAYYNGKKVLSVVKVGAISGNLIITDTQIKDVSQYATAQVVDANLIPANIKKDVSILGIVGTHEGGQQPTLFAPVITSGTNTVSWANDTRNGGFSVTLSATVDGVTVSSPLTVTEQMDGKTLIVTASATNFQNAVTTVSLSYESVFVGSRWQMNSVVSASGLRVGANYVGCRFSIGVSDKTMINVDGGYTDYLKFTDGSGTNERVVYFYPQYGWYTRVGSGERTIINAPIIEILSCVDSDPNAIKAWFQANGTQI